MSLTSPKERSDMPKYQVHADYMGCVFGRATAEIEASCIWEAVAMANQGEVDWHIDADQQLETPYFKNIKVIGDE